MKFVLLFEGTDGNKDESPNCISKFNNMLKTECDQFVKQIDGSGRHGSRLSLITGKDSAKIIYNQYNWLREQVAQLPKGEDAEIYVFGFSRGAFQSVVFVNFLNSIGIVEDVNSENDLIEAYFHPKEGAAHRIGSIKISYVGLVDIVRAVTGCNKLKDVEMKIPDGIRSRHAIALHEYRPWFKAQVLDKSNPQVEQMTFIGSHTDVGWGYNGKPVLRLDILNSLGIKTRNNLQETKTSCLGKIVLGWVIAPVIDKLDVDCKEIAGYLDDNVHIYDYFTLLISFAYIMHDPTYDFSNGCSGMKSQRDNIKDVSLHNSARILHAVLDKGLLVKAGVDPQSKQDISDTLLRSLTVDKGGEGIFNLSEEAVRQTISAVILKYEEIIKEIQIASLPREYDIVEEMEYLKKQSPFFYEMIQFDQCVKQILAKNLTLGELLLLKVVKEIFDKYIHDMMDIDRFKKGIE